AALEFAVGAFEVVLLEAPLIGNPSVLAEFEHIEVGRLVPNVIQPTAQRQRKALTSHCQRLPLEAGELSEDSLNSCPQLGPVLYGVTVPSPPIVIHELIGVRPDDSGDISGPHRR